MVDTSYALSVDLDRSVVVNNRQSYLMTTTCNHVHSNFKNAMIWVLKCVFGVNKKSNYPLP